MEKEDKQDNGTIEELNSTEESNKSGDILEDSKGPDSNKEKENKKKLKTITTVIILLIVVALSFLVYKNYQDSLKTNPEDKDKGTIKTEKDEVYSEYRINSNALEDFDLYFLQLENNQKNKIYSPLSIKYALEMLNEGADGDSKTQINSIVGDYKARKYTNSDNMSFANAMFINNNYKNGVKEKYTNNLRDKYNAEIIYDSFETPNNVNNWVSNKTFNLVNNLVDNVSDKSFLLINALAIDMEWKNVFQQKREGYGVSYEHENFGVHVSSLESGYPSLEFNNGAKKTKAVSLAAEANKYDIVSTLGEKNIRATVGSEYEKWLKAGACGSPEEEPDVNTYLDQYIKEINSNYHHLSSSTDFTFYDDAEVKVLGKDLKEYNGTTLQYIGIMPKETSLDQYIENMNAKKINTLISSLKGIELDSFKDGVITKVVGTIPLFKIDYELKLLDDLKTLGITDIFDQSKANLTGISSEQNLFIDSAIHKANIEFSNEGIKAAAATALGGRGAAACGFDYYYDVPVETIDLTFDKPYLYLVRDKNTGEVWFAGTVYEPLDYSER